MGRNRSYDGVRAVFFDAGLTLIYSEPPLAERCARIANEHGLRITAADVEAALPRATAMMAAAYRANPHVWSSDDALQEHWRDFYMAIFRATGAAGDLETCADAIYAEYNEPGAWILFPDVLPTLERLHSEGYIIGVISDWGSSLASNVLLPLGVGPYISFMIVSATVREGKPGYGLYREALARAGVQPHQAIHVGDNYINDVLGARAAGIAGVLLDRSGTHTGPLDCPRIESLAELPELLHSRMGQQTHRPPL